MDTLQQEAVDQQQAAESWNAAELIKWGLERFGSTLGIASSFGAEDVVLVELAARAGIPYRVFTLDTDFLFPETYTLIDSTEKKYGIHIERARPLLMPDEQVAKHSGRASPICVARSARSNRSRSLSPAFRLGSPAYAATRRRNARMPRKSIGTPASAW